MYQMYMCIHTYKTGKQAKYLVLECATPSQSVAFIVMETPSSSTTTYGIPTTTAAQPQRQNMLIF